MFVFINEGNCQLNMYHKISNMLLIKDTSFMTKDIKVLWKPKRQYLLNVNIYIPGQIFDCNMDRSY